MERALMTCMIWLLCKRVNAMTIFILVHDSFTAIIVLQVLIWHVWCISSLCIVSPATIITTIATYKLCFGNFRELCIWSTVMIGRFGSDNSCLSQSKQRFASRMHFTTRWQLVKWMVGLALTHCILDMMCVCVRYI